MDNFLTKYGQTDNQPQELPKDNSDPMSGFLTKYSGSTNPKPDVSAAPINAKSTMPSLGDNVVKTASGALGREDYNGWCEAFVSRVQGREKKYGSAIESWRKQQDKAVPSLQGIQPGDAVYFDADNSNEGYGHTAIYKGNGNIIGATYDGIKEMPLQQWVSSTGQKPLGYIPLMGGKE